jgi:hypothetical protein
VAQGIIDLIPSHRQSSRGSGIPSRSYRTA